MHFVFLFIFFLISFKFIFHEFLSQSIKTGMQLFFITANAEDIIVKFGIIISDPFFSLRDFIAISKAVVPLDRHIPYFFPTFLES